MIIPLQMACSKTVEVTIQFKKLSGSYQNKAGKPAQSRKNAKDEGGRITTSSRDRKMSLPLRQNAKERKIMKPRIIIPAYKVGTLPVYGSKNGPPQAARWGGFWISTSGKSDRPPMPKKAMQLTTDDAWKTQKRVQDSQTPKGLNKRKEWRDIIHV